MALSIVTCGKINLGVVLAEANGIPDVPLSTTTLNHYTLERGVDRSAPGPA